MEIDGRRVVVTGASRGIGAATAVAAARRGARVALLARTESDLETVAERCRRAGGAASVHPVDLADADATARTGAALREAGEVDVLINNAGVGDWTAVTETSPEQARAAMRVPYFAAFDLTGALLPGMLERDRGRVAFVTSPAAYVPIPGASAYTASRWAVRGFAHALRGEVRETGVGVTLVVPGVVESSYFEANDNVRERLPPGADLRSVSPERVGEAVVEGLESGATRVVEPPEYRLVVATGQLSTGLARRLAGRGYDGGG